MLNKNVLRQFADNNPAPAIPAGHGLLHAPQVDYIIRTAVRIINHRRTLVLYVYDRTKAANGDPSPIWTMFQAGEDYITLARREDGSVHWREAAFEGLDRSYRFKDKCAFYSAQDEQRVRDFFYDGNCSGIAALVCAQKAILDKRRHERQCKREKQIIERMRPLRALPRGWQNWVRRSVMPAYFFYDYQKGAKSVTGICSACGKDITLTGVRHNAKAACPHCKRELTMKSKGRMGKIMDRDTVQFIQRTAPDELVIRVIKVYHTYDRDTAKREFYESIRIFVSRGPDGNIRSEHYYSCNGGILTDWKCGIRSVYVFYQYQFHADTSGHVYCRNLPDVLAGTTWEYCPIKLFYEHFRESMELLPFLRELDVSMGTLQVFQGYAGLKDRQRLLRWQLDHNVTHDIDHVLEHVTAHKFMKYMDGQYAAPCTDGGRGRYNNMQSAVSEYRDYLDMCIKLDYDLGNSFVLYPRDLQEAHDKAQGRIKAKADAQMRRDFKAAMQAITVHLDFEMDGMKLVLPSGPEELAAEGNALHHCVGGYADRVARKECIILFLRQCENIDKPFYTVEVRGGKIVQVRGMSNRTATPDVEAFMSQWERQVLRRQGMADAA